MTFEESPLFITILTVVIGCILGVVVKCLNKYKTAKTKKNIECVEECIESIVDALVPGTKKISDAVEPDKKNDEAKITVHLKREESDPAHPPQSSPTEIRKEEEEKE
jgi:hypothetical protein